VEEGWGGGDEEVGREPELVWRWNIRMTTEYNAYIIADAAEK
jgi:hypothetical protein